MISLSHIFIIKLLKSWFRMTTLNLSVRTKFFSFLDGITQLSLGAKGQFILNNKLAGFSMWEATADENNILLNAIRAKVFPSG
jgi:hypothetical protein